MEFDQWMEEMKLIVDEVDMKYGMGMQFAATYCDPDVWQQEYVDGLSPKEAMEAEMSNFHD